MLHQPADPAPAGGASQGAGPQFIHLDPAPVLPQGSPQNLNAFEPRQIIPENYPADKLVGERRMHPAPTAMTGPPPEKDKQKYTLDQNREFCKGKDRDCGLRNFCDL
jgi:hypothetical protein